MSFLKNPFQAWASKGVQLPKNLQNPDDIINYLLQSGKLTQDQYNQVYAQYRDLANKGLIPNKPM